MNIITLNKSEYKQDIISIGVFDGIHKGHQTIIKKMLKLSTKYSAKTVLLTFNPHPLHIVKNPHSVPMLSCEDEKISLAKHYGVNDIAIVNFTKEISKLMPEEFINSFLIKRFKPVYILVGEDFRFGYKRAGDCKLLIEMGKKYNFHVECLSAIKDDNKRISSTLIREHLINGEIEKANNYLGRAYSFSGKVFKGFGIGRKIGYPTANISMDCNSKLIPLEGIYAVKVKWDKKLYNGALYIGKRPTFNISTDLTVEVYILDLDEANLYDEYLEVFFLKKIRDDKKFDSKNDLKMQIIKDIEQIKKFFFTLRKEYIILSLLEKQRDKEVE